MKKIICFAIILIMALTACSGNIVETNNPEDTLNTEENGMSTEEENPNTPEEDLSTDAETNPAAEKIAEAISMRTDEFTDGFYPLRDKGFELFAENVKTIDGFWFSYDLHIKNEKGKEAVIPVTGVYREKYAAAHGGFSVIDMETIAFCGFEYAAFIDRETLAVTKINLDYSDIGEEVWINGLMKTEDGFAILATPMGEIGYGPDEEYETFFIRFDESGKQAEKITLPKATVSLNRYYTMPEFGREMYIIETEEGRIFKNVYSTFNLDTGKSLGTEEIAAFGTEERSVVIYRYSDSETYEYIGNVAVLFENGKAVSTASLGKEIFYVYDHGDGKKGEGTVSSDRKAVFVDDFYGMTISIDFSKGTGEISYKIEDKHLYEIIEESADWKYALWAANYSAGGDANHYNVVLKNNESGKITKLGEGGGMYGGGTEAGFLKNGDVYLTDYTELEIYDPETAEVIFTAAENFPLGKLDDGRYRYLFTFRRNPEDFSFIVVYFETEEGGIEWDYDEIVHADGKFHCELPHNYKIGFLDAEGNLLESYDTGCGVWYDGFGLQGVSMRYSEKELTLITSYTKGNDGFIGIFDMETKTFSYNY